MLSMSPFEKEHPLALDVKNCHPLAVQRSRAFVRIIMICLKPCLLTLSLLRSGHYVASIVPKH
jgi:hypothetical protein